MKEKKKEYRLARSLKKKLPLSFQRKWSQLLERKFKERTTSTKENQRLMEEFQLQQITIAFWGIVGFIAMVLFLHLFSAFSSSMTFMRNPFGAGEKEILLTMESGKEREQISIMLEEQELSQEEEDQVFSSFFQELEQLICGDNPSLNRVNEPLQFLEEMKGYPFFVTYQPEDMNYINWDGRLGEKALQLREGEKIDTFIMVEASYKDYLKEKKIKVTLIPPEEKEKSVFDRFREHISRKESSSREEAGFTVDHTWDRVKVSEASKAEVWKFPLLFVAVIGLLLLRNHIMLTEQGERRHKENMEDFPLIVHLLTLYMGAGLSFASAIERICKDYEKKIGKEKERYAFEQIRLMNHVMHMGVRPRDACLSWGNQFHEKVYAKFAMILSQGLSKGAKEIRSLMEREQQEAFQVQVDFVRKEGETASTKLLFPMIILLAAIMIMIMFPAMLQFYAM